MQHWWLELGNLLSPGGLGLHSQVLGVSQAVVWNTGKLLLVASLRLTVDDLSRWWLDWAVRLCNRNSDWVTSDLLTTLLFEDDLQMSRSGDVQEVLRVPAPELVLTTLLVDPRATGSIFRSLLPGSEELLLDGVRHLNDVDWVTREHPEEERTLHVSRLLGQVSVWNDHVVHILLLVSRVQRAGMSNLTLAEPLPVLCCF